MTNLLPAWVLEARGNQSASLQRDHVIPISRGGDHTMSNLVPACATCNRHKSARGPLAMLGKGM